MDSKIPYAYENIFSNSIKNQNHSGISYEVLIPARDEEENILKVINSLKKQTIPPSKITLLNDNSKDRTKEIGKELDITVIDFPFEHPKWVNVGKLGIIFSYGMKKFNKNNTHFMILGADHLLPENYVEDCINLMNENNVDVCSGIIENEISGSPRGSGRIYSRKAMESINWKYPSNFGFETYALFKIQSSGLKAAVFPIITKTLRPTGKTYSKKKYLHMGYSYRALGYTLFYGVGRGLVIGRKYGFLNGIMFSTGYLLNRNKTYENQVKEFCRSNLKHNFKDIFLNPKELLAKL